MRQKSISSTILYYKTSVEILLLLQGQNKRVASKSIKTNMS